MPKSGYIALAGKPNVGKSSLLNALVGQHLAIESARAQATRLPVIGLRTEGDVQYVFHDLPGLLDPEYLMQERMRALALDGIRGADVILYLHPADEAPAPDFGALAGLAGPPRAPVLTVFTKADLVDPDLRARLARTGIPVSVRSGAGLEALLGQIRDRLPEGPFPFDPEDLATQPLRFFAVEFLREAVFELLREEVPYAFTAEIEEFRETEDPVFVRASLYVESRSQKQILIGAGGRVIREVGRYARERLERLLGRRVYLETWVQVLPKWRRDPAQLARFGFPG